jgi:hypothetical protein
MYDALRDAVTELPATFRCWLRSPAWWAWVVIAATAGALIAWLT